MPIKMEDAVIVPLCHHATGPPFACRSNRRPCSRLPGEVPEAQDPQIRPSRQEFARPLFSAPAAVPVPFLVRLHLAGEVAVEGFQIAE